MTEHELALAFCQRHDWGRDAVLIEGRIEGLREAYTTTSGEHGTDVVAVLATMEAVRAFGGY